MSTGTTAVRFGAAAAQAGTAADMLTHLRERLALTDEVDRHALDGAIAGANSCRTWCEFLERRARESGNG